MRAARPGDPHLTLRHRDDLTRRGTVPIHGAGTRHLWSNGLTRATSSVAPSGCPWWTWAPPFRALRPADRQAANDLRGRLAAASGPLGRAGGPWWARAQKFQVARLMR